MTDITQPTPDAPPAKRRDVRRIRARQAAAKAQAAARRAGAAEEGLWPFLRSLSDAVLKRKNAVTLALAEYLGDDGMQKLRDGTVNVPSFVRAVFREMASR